MLEFSPLSLSLSHSSFYTNKRKSNWYFIAQNSFPPPGLAWFRWEVGLEGWGG